MRYTGNNYTKPITLRLNASRNNSLEALKRKALTLIWKKQITRISFQTF